LITAHVDLESLTLERELGAEKRRLEPVWADLVYKGLWFSPLREALDAFVASSQRSVTGDVRLRLTPGGCLPIARRSEIALYDDALATYTDDDTFEHGDAAGFVRLWGLPTRRWAQVQNRK
jgi:argininosuccinate synthase